MNEKKKECPLLKLSSVVYMWIAFGCGFIAWLMMFCPAFYDFARWSRPVSAMEVFFPQAGGLSQGAWPAFIGYMLVIFAMLANGILAMPLVQPSEKTEKRILIGSIICEAIGLILVSFIAIEYCGLNGSLHSLGGCYMMGGTITFIVFDVLMIASTSMALYQDW